MRVKLNYGGAVTVIPGAAAEKVLSQSVSVLEIKVLFELFSPENTDISEKEFCGKVSGKHGVSVSKVEGALGFWRGAGVISLEETETPTDTQDDKETFVQDKILPQGNAELKEKEKTLAQTEMPPQSHGGKIPEEEKVLAQSEISSQDGDNIEPEKGKTLSKGEIPSYSAEDISNILECDGEALRIMIDECQQIMGRIFNSTEIRVFVGMCDYLGLKPDYMVTAVAYFAKKKPGCSIRYIEKALIGLADQNIVTLEDLDSYVKSMELYDGVSGRLRTLTGIGGRAFTKKENDKINNWIKGFGYGIDIIEYAYEITVDATGNFSFEYASAILENWYKGGIKTVEEARESTEKYRSDKKKKGSSFNDEEFFELALQRSYRKMNEGKEES